MCRVYVKIEERIIEDSGYGILEGSNPERDEPVRYKEEVGLLERLLHHLFAEILTKARVDCGKQKAEDKERLKGTVHDVCFPSCCCVRRESPLIISTDSAICVTIAIDADV
jgi:hypothetical protein